MKTDELKALGLTDEQINGVFALNGKDVERYKTRAAGLEAELENAKEQFRQADETLKKFGDMTPDKYQEELEKYKNAAEQAEKDFRDKLLARDQSDWLDKKLEEYGVNSPYARRQLKSECLSEESGLKWKDDSFFGFDDFMKAAKEKDNSLYLTAEEKAEAEKLAKAKEQAARFTDPMGDGEPDGAKKYTPPIVF